MTRLLIAGATGLIGGIVLAKALADPRIQTIVAPTRRALPVHSKLTNPIVDFAALPEDASWWAVDSVVSTMGTTRAATPSLIAYRAIDHDYVLAAATLAMRHGATGLALVSAMGANARSPLFYPRLKGEIERDVAALGFRSLTIARPGFIGGVERDEARGTERLVSQVLGALAPVLPRRYRISQADRIAKTLIEAAVCRARPPCGRSRSPCRRLSNADDALFSDVHRTTTPSCGADEVVPTVGETRWVCD